MKWPSATVGKTTLSSEAKGLGDGLTTILGLNVIFINTLDLLFTKQRGDME